MKSITSARIRRARPIAAASATLCGVRDVCMAHHIQLVAALISLGRFYPACYSLIVDMRGMQADSI